MPPIIPPLILTLRWSERKKTEKRNKTQLFYILLWTQEWGILENQWMNSRPQSFLQFAPDDHYITKCILSKYRYRHSWRQTLSSASVTWMPRILKSWTSCRLWTVPSLLMGWHNDNHLSFLSKNLFRSNILNASFISWICSSVNWSATLDMLSSCSPDALQKSFSILLTNTM